MLAGVDLGACGELLPPARRAALHRLLAAAAGRLGDGRGQRGPGAGERLSPTTSQRPVEVRRAAASRWILPLDVLGRLERPHQHDRVRRASSCCLGHRLADRTRHEHPADIEPAHTVAVHLVHDDQPLFAVDVDRERRATSPRAAGWRCLDGPLDVLRVVVAPAHDDQVLDAAGDEQLAVRDEAEVAGAQERPFAVRPAVRRKVCSVSSWLPQ